MVARRLTESEPMTPEAAVFLVEARGVSRMAVARGRLSSSSVSCPCSLPAHLARDMPDPVTAERRRRTLSTTQGSKCAAYGDNLSRPA
jgi:hypothetical protein